MLVDDTCKAVRGDVLSFAGHATLFCCCQGKFTSAICMNDALVQFSAALQLWAPFWPGYQQRYETSSMDSYSGHPADFCLPLSQ